MPGSAFVGPAVLVAVLFAQLAWVLILPGDAASTTSREIHPKEVGLTLFGPYVLAVELAAFLLLAAMVGAYHLGRRYMRTRRGGAA